MSVTRRSTGPPDAAPRPAGRGISVGFSIGPPYTALNVFFDMDVDLDNPMDANAEPKPPASDFLVLGSGLAGLTFALSVARLGPVTVVAKRELLEGNTSYAQGGIAAALGPEDSASAHIADTLECGVGLSKRATVEMIVGGAREAVARLVALGIPFERHDDGAYDLHREGGHSQRRILHARDATGRQIMEGLVAAVTRHPNIRVLPHHCAVDLILEHRLVHGADSGTRCLGAYVLDTRERRIAPIAAKVTLLATGGSGKVYRYTTNSDVATGDGLAMAWRAGCRVANLEFVQFHPTCLYHPEAKDFLITEAVRGEGAYLTTISGDRLEIDHPLGDLAPRDVVARAIDRVMKRRGDRCVHLHLEHLPAEKIRREFPTIYATLAKLGIDITVQPIPVVPAAHYQCGGVVSDLDGHTELPGLYAAGEVAFTGLHGANRLASNSLLEAAVMGERSAAAALRDIADFAHVPDLPPWDASNATLPRETVLIDAHWEIMRKVMWDLVGIMRNDYRLSLAARYIEIFRKSIESYYWDFVLDRDLIELRNLALVAELIVESARRRLESRGLHYNEDHPARDDVSFGADTILSPTNALRPLAVGGAA